VSSRKLTYAVSLPLLALGSAFVILLVGGGAASDVRADMEVAETDQDTLALAETFEGEYVFVGGQKERDGLDAAIEASVEAVNALVRNLGRTRLREANVIPQRLTISIDGDRAKILFDGSGHDASLDGTVIKTVGVDGEKVKVSHRMRGAQLVELIDGLGGDRSNTFKLSSDGSRVTMAVEITSGQLPVPVVYRLTFKRK
jgi:hypothetical protein